MVYGIVGIRALQVPLVSIGVDCGIWDSGYTCITSATSEYRR